MSNGGPSRIRRPQAQMDDDLVLHNLIELLTLDGLELTTILDKQQRGLPLTSAELSLLLVHEDAENARIFEEDHALALQLQGNPQEHQVLGRRFIQPQGLVLPDETTLLRPRARLQPLNHVREETNSDQNAGWGSWLVSAVAGLFATSEGEVHDKGTPTSQGSLTGKTCVICQDPIRGAALLTSCGHHYDKTCLSDLFEAAIKDESLYPPRCCRQNIPPQSARSHLSTDLFTRFSKKATEFGTLKRVYCARPTCSHFLGAETSFASALVCPSCSERTCGRCKHDFGSYFSHTCKESVEEQQILSLGKNSGWARCPGCSQLIELNMGCYHMTCRCKTEFCYLCKAIWKSCVCVQWDERRLLLAAEQRVDAQIRRPPPPPPAQIWRVAPEGRPPAPPTHQPVVPTPRARTPVVRPIVGAAQLGPLAAPRVAIENRTLALANLTQTRPIIPPPPNRTSTLRTVIPAAPKAPVRSDSIKPSTRTSLNHPTQLVASSSSVTNPQRSTPILPNNVPPLLSKTGTTRQEQVGNNADTRSGRHLSTGKGNGHQVLENDIFQSRQNLRPIPSASSGLTSLPSTSKSKGKGVSRPTVSTTPQSVRDRLVREMMDDLRENHDCQHVSWKYKRGGGKCDTCYHDLPSYLFRCDGCRISACNRCRRNRL